ncbi:anti-phage protein GapS2 [Photobacterium sp. J15]|uniref:anti-phage protein GapS2 n=1 Tax=Photobacterium sp. J15 TaxID=265901 RepID=UPI001E4B4FD7|nr:BRCT domain-containing protein [Photobacterium sp. J15]
MTVFELLGINPGDAITVDNPWSDNGPREVVPLALSRNGISIRAIDCRYGDIRYVSGEWTVFMSDGDTTELQDFPYVKQKIEEWNFRKQKQLDAHERAQKELRLEDFEREYATLDEVLSTINIVDLKVAVTGTLPLPRAEVKSLLESKGATVMGSVSSRTSFLFMGNTGKYEITSKMKKAHDLGVKIITL